MLAAVSHLAAVQPLFLGSFAGAFILAVALVAFAGARLGASGAVEAMLLMAVAAEWCLSYFLEVTLPTRELKILTVRCSYLGLATLPVLWFLLAARMTGLVDLAGPWRVAAVVPLAAGRGNAPVPVAAGDRPRPYRARASAMVAAGVAPGGLHALTLVGGAEIASLSFAPFAVAGSGIAVSWALFRFRLVDLVPISRSAAVDTMADPVVVDAEGRVADANPAARALFDAPHRPLVGSLAAATGAIGRLAGGIAHDFNNLLTAITGFSEMLLLGEGVSAESCEWVGEIRRSIERGSSLVRYLLAFSRKQMTRPRVCSLNDLIAGIERMLTHLIGEHIRLELELDPALPSVRADAGQLEIAIVNLAANARDATPSGGRLAIEIRSRGSQAILRVRDTGVGMDEQVRRPLFEPLFTTKPSGKGTGLGLSTVYGIVQQCSGTIAVDSRPGAGSTVDSALPAATPEARSDSEAPAASPTPGGCETVLVVEDDPTIRRLIDACLRPPGYAVTLAEGTALPPWLTRRQASTCC